MKKICLFVLILLIITNTVSCSKQKNAGDKAAEKSSQTNESNVQTDENSTGTISIALERSNRLIESAAKSYEAKNPGVKVDLKVYTTPTIKSNGNTTVAVAGDSKAKYLDTINTEIMAGKGDDIIFANGLPYTKYADKKMFADLSKLMESDKSFDRSKYFSNLFDALKYNGGLYIIPIDYIIQMMSMQLDKDNSGITVDDSKWKWDDLFKTGKTIISNGKQKSGKKYVIGATSEGIFYDMVRYSSKSFIDMEKKSANFTIGGFKNMLSYCKNLTDSGVIVKDTDIGKLKDSSLVFSQDVSGAWQFFGDFNPKAPKVKQYKYPSDDGSGKLSFYSTQIFAINNNSKNKNLAWKFIKYLLSEDVQSSVEMAGTPVNRAAVRKQGENIIGSLKDELSKSGVKISDDNVNDKLDQYVKKVEELAKDIDRYNKMDPTIEDIISQETKAFFQGKKTAEDTAQTIQNKVSTYLKEQQ